MERCENCNELEPSELYTIKWPGLDTGIQYVEVCRDCYKAFVEWRQSKGKDKTIFERGYLHDSTD